MSTPSERQPDFGFSVDVSSQGIHLSQPPEPEPELPPLGGTIDVGLSSAAPVESQPAVMPGKMAMAASAARSMIKYAASGFKRVDGETYKARLQQCQPCQHRVDNRCLLCGCWLDRKAWMPHEDCPAGRWPKLTE